MSTARSRRVAAGANATMTSVLVVVALGFVYLLADAYRVRVDLSVDQSSVLAPETLQKLATLDKGPPVTLTAFSSQQGRPDAALKDRQLRDFLQALDERSTAIDAAWVEFDRDRLTAERLGVAEYGTVVLQRGDQRVDISDRELFRRVGTGADKRLEFLGEASVGRAFAQVLADRKRIVYALVGHGEPDVEGRDPGGLAEFARLLGQDDIALKTLDLVRDGAPGAPPRIPDDASALAILGARTALPAAEEDVILGAMSRGLPLLVTADVGWPAPGVLARLGVGILDGFVLDPMLVFPFPDRPVPRYRPHPITTDLSAQSLVTVMSRVAPVQPAVPAREGVRVTTLLETGRDGWIERGGALVNGTARYEPDLDGAGPVAMAVAIEIDPSSGLVTQGTGRVLVVGDTDLLTNSLLAEGPGNPTFVANAVRWLIGDEAALSLVGRPQGARRLALTQEDLDRLRWISLGVGPVLAALLGLGAWALRRGR
jgi:hypothetical protein